jgi:hypothetical protein
LKSQKLVKLIEKNNHKPRSYIYAPKSLQTINIEYFYYRYIKKRYISMDDFKTNNPILPGDEKNSVVIATKILREFLRY